MRELLPPLQWLAQGVSAEGWNDRGCTSSFVNHHGIIEVFVFKILAIVRGGRNFSPGPGLVFGLRRADGIGLELGEGVCGEEVQVIVREVALEVCVASHAVRPSLDAGLDPAKPLGHEILNVECLNVV